MGLAVRGAIWWELYYAHLYRKHLHEGRWEEAEEALEGLRFWRKIRKEAARTAEILDELGRLLS